MVLYKWFLERLQYPDKVHLDGAEDSVYSIGRGKENFLKCPSVFVSRRHCTIAFKSNDSLVIKDLGSSNGTFVNKSKILKNRDIPLEPGDEIGLGVTEVQNAEYYIFKLLQEEILPSPAPSVHLSDDEVVLDCQVIVLSDSDESNIVKKEPCGDVKAEPCGDVKTEPCGDVKAEPCGDVKAEPCGDVKAEPRGDVKTEPCGDVKTEPRDDVRSEPSSSNTASRPIASVPCTSTTCEENQLTLRNDVQFVEPSTSAVTSVFKTVEYDETVVNSSRFDEASRNKSDQFRESSLVNNSGGTRDPSGKEDFCTSTPKVSERVVPFLRTLQVDTGVQCSPLYQSESNMIPVKMEESPVRSESVNNIHEIKMEPRLEHEFTEITISDKRVLDDGKSVVSAEKFDGSGGGKLNVPSSLEESKLSVINKNIYNVEGKNCKEPQYYYRIAKKAVEPTEKYGQSCNSDILKKISSPSAQPFVRLVRYDQNLETSSPEVTSSSDPAGDYTLEDDVVIISDDDDDQPAFSSDVNSGTHIKEEAEEEDNAEDANSDSDNEWWPKLSQSFLESIEREEAEMQNEEAPDRHAGDEDDDSDDVIVPTGKRKRSVLSEDPDEFEGLTDGGSDNFETFPTAAKRKSSLAYGENEERTSTGDLNTNFSDNDGLSSFRYKLSKDLEMIDHAQVAPDVVKPGTSMSEPYHSDMVHDFSRNNETPLSVDFTKKKAVTPPTSRKLLLIDAPPMHHKHSRRKDSAKPAPKRKSPEDCRKKTDDEKLSELASRSSEGQSTPKVKRRRRRSNGTPTKSVGDPLSPSHKKKIHDLRKEKLKALASQSKSVSSEQTANRTKAKVPIKNTKLSRGDILVEDLVPAYKINRDAVPSTSSESNSKKVSSIKENSKVKKSNDPPEGMEVPTVKPAVKLSFKDLPKIPKRSKESEKAKVDNKRAGSATLSESSNIQRGPERWPKDVNELAGNRSRYLISHISVPPVPIKPAIHNALDPNKMKKRVSFKCDDDLCQVHLVPVDNFSTLRRVAASVKDAPVNRHNYNFRSSDTSRINILDQTLFKICNWNVKWLQEQKGSSRPPPCYGNVPLCPMLTSFSSYDDYFKIANPLMLLTLWAKVSDDSSKADCRCVPNVVVLDKVEEKTIDDNMYMQIRCHVLLTPTADKNQIHPYAGDLCQMDIYLDPTTVPSDDHNLVVAESQGSTVHCVRLFTYVESINKEVYSTDNKKEWAHVDPKQRPTCKLNIILKMKHKTCIQKNYKLKLKVLCNIRSELRVFEAVAMLPKSRLCSKILSPMIHDYILPTVDPRKQRLVLKDFNLNDDQKKAVFRSSSMCMQPSPKIALIQGPPGTGKSTVIVNIIMQILYGEQNYVKNYRRGSRPRILLCAPSNAAVDELVIRLLSVRQTFPKEERFRMVRVGRINAMRSSVREISLQELTKRDMKQGRFEGETMESVEIEIRNQEAKRRSYETSLDCARKRNADVSLYLKKISEVDRKIAQLRNLTERKVEQQVDKRLERQTQLKILSGADIVATTLGSCSLSLISEVFGGSGEIRFTCCILDEATQCCEPEGLLPLMLGIEKLVLVGDPEQLPATVVSKSNKMMSDMTMEAQSFGYGQSLFTRIWNKFSAEHESPIQFLTIQHRMDPEICRWPSQYFYNNRVSTSLLRPPKLIPLKPYVVLSEEFTQVGYNEVVNQSEAKLVCLLASMIYEQVERNTSICIITPYAKQRTEILKYMGEDRSMPSNCNVPVNTIDSFQGQECDIVIMSCARTEGVGFMTDTQRLCVALTRARFSLIICGNFVSLSRDLMWQELLDNASQRGLLFKLKCSRMPRKEDVLKYIMR